MTGPDRRILVALDGGRSLDHRQVLRATRLAETTLAVSLRKLERMGWISRTDDGYRLCGRGRQQARALRTGVTEAHGPAVDD